MRTLFSRSLLCVAFAVSLTACDSADGGGSSVTGTVLSPTGNPIAGAVVSTSSSAAPAGGAALRQADDSATTDEDGEYELDLDPGVYTLTITRPGYTPQTVSVTVTDEGAEAPAVELRGNATITGTVNSSQGSGEVAGATVTFTFPLPGRDPLDAPAELEVQTNADGVFTIPNAPSGVLDCVIYADTYEPSVILGIPVQEGENTLDPTAIVETPPSGAVRVTLTWSQAPSDLDSHLTGPDGQGGRYHVYFVTDQVGPDSLDVDDISSFGPETITFYPTRQDGMYRYSVHNYSDQSATGARGIAGLNADGAPNPDGRAARVELVVTNQQGVVTTSRVYTAPAAGSDADADTWRVFEIDASGDQITIRDGGGSGLGYVQASGSSDIGTFRTAGEVWDLPRK